MPSQSLCKQLCTTINDTLKTRDSTKMDQFLIWQILEISSTLINSEQRKMHQSRILLSINSHKQQASVTSLNLVLQVRQRTMSRLSTLIILPNSHVEKITNSLYNHSRRKRLSELNILMKLVQKRVKYTNTPFSQINQTRVYTINLEGCIDTRRMPKDLFISRLYKTT